MASSSAERKAKQRAREKERERVIAAAKTFVPEPGERQDRAVEHAIYIMEGYEAGTVAHPYPAALR